MSSITVSGVPAAEQSSRQIDHLIFWAAILGLAWAPFWFGSNREIAWVINAGYFGGLVLVFEGSLLGQRRAHPVSAKRVAFAILAFAAVCGWICIQASTLTPPPWHHPFWQFESEGLDLDLPGSITINRADTYVALLRLLTEGCVFWLFLQLGRSPQRAHLLVKSIAGIGIIYAIYGLVAFFVLPGTVLWFTKDAYLESVTSTFINRNSYATYAGIGLLCGLAVSVDQYVRDGARAGRSTLRRAAALLASTAGPAGRWLAGSFTLGMALVLTGSRGGILASIAGLLAFALLMLMRGRSAVAGLGTFLALFTVAIAVFAFGDLFAARLTSFGDDAADRLAVYRLTYLSIFDAPWTGYGYGTFKTVFPMYRDNSVPALGIWDKAHNTYLEIFQGLGIPLATLFIGLLLTLVGRCAYAALTRHSAAMVPLVATGATAIVALHALVDFSMQIQAVALTWTALIGAGVAQSWSARVSTSG
jgi:O-antigen ligase